jgi:hypothetical protein
MRRFRALRTVTAFAGGGDPGSHRGLGDSGSASCARGGAARVSSSAARKRALGAGKSASRVASGFFLASSMTRPREIGSS